MKILFFGRKNCDGSDVLARNLVGRGHTVEVFLSSKRGEELSESVLAWSGDLILSYRNLVIIPEKVLDRAHLAVNFHPGPPEYPGSGCVNFALLDDAKSYGVTCHVMAGKVDEGAILDVRRFTVSSDTNLADLLAETHRQLLDLAKDFIEKVSILKPCQLERLASASSEYKWSGIRRKIAKIDALQEIRMPITLGEFERRKRALHLPAFPLFIRIFGYKFELREDD